jgi:hypothetical protein
MQLVFYMTYTTMHGKTKVKFSVNPIVALEKLV